MQVMKKHTLTATMNTFGMVGIRQSTQPLVKLSTGLQTLPFMTLELTRMAPSQIKETLQKSFNPMTQRIP